LIYPDFHNHLHVVHPTHAEGQGLTVVRTTLQLQLWASSKLLAHISSLVLTAVNITKNNFDIVRCSVAVLESGIVPSYHCYTLEFHPMECASFW